MRFFIDTEFIDNGKQILPLSLAVVAENGDAFYAVVTDTDRSLAGPWVHEHVLPYVDSDHWPHFERVPGATLTGICDNHTNVAHSFREWVAERSTSPEFWADYGSYDWVMLCQLYGSMLERPLNWPMFVRDIQQIRNGRSLPEPKFAHHALSDAYNCRDRWRICTSGNSVEPDGAALISQERQRQIDSEGWDPEHDAEHTSGELLAASSSYILASDVVRAMAAESTDSLVTYVNESPPSQWPWDLAWWKPSTDQKKNLVKAGALIAAEIDRLIAEEKKNERSI